MLVCCIGLSVLISAKSYRQSILKYDSGALTNQNRLFIRRFIQKLNVQIITMQQEVVMQLFIEAITMIAKVFFIDRIFRLIKKKKGCVMHPFLGRREYEACNMYRENNS